MIKQASQSLSRKRSEATNNPHEQQEVNFRHTASNRHEESFATSADALSELAQARIRNWIHVVVVLLAAVAMQLDSNIDPIKVFATAAVGIPAGAFLYLWARYLNDKRPHRYWRIGQRVTCMVSDMFFITWVLYFGGVTFAGLFALYIWITVGYGIRYGLKYLFCSLVRNFVTVNGKFCEA